jgi:predicted nucleotidyltransferase
MDNMLKIINYLGKNVEKAYTMNELSTLLKIPYATFYRTVQNMKDILNVKAIGKAKTIKLNLKNPVIKSYLTIASDEEKKSFMINQPVIKKISCEMETKDIVVLFGSYAKSSFIETSDIDILVINKDGKKSLNFSKFELLYKKKINPIFVTYKEFNKMLLAKEENIGKQVLKNHIILNNPDKFWRFVLHAVR